MIEELRARFRTRFIETARGRVRLCLELLGKKHEARILETELHSLAGEAAMLGLEEICQAAREGELAARDWAQGNNAAQLRCARLVRTVSQRVEAFAAEEPAVDEEAGSDAVDEEDNTKTRVLVIDDSAISGERLIDAVSDAGMRGRLVASSADALAAITSFAPEIVLSDVNMPGVDLASLCASLRQASAKPVFIILISGMSEDALAQRAKDVHADSYVTKEHGIEHVVEWLRQIRRESSP